MTRQEANRELLKLISNRIEEFPDQRLNQIIVNLKITKDVSGSYYQSSYNHLDYYEEPMVTLDRITKE